MLIYDVAFSAETDQLKTQINALKAEIDKIFVVDKATGKSQAMFDPLKTEGKAAAQFLQQALQKATSVDGTSLSRFNAELAKSGTSAERLATLLRQAGMTQNLNALVTTIASADTKLTVLNDHLKEMHRVLAQSVKFRAAMAVQDFLVGQAQAAIQWTKDLNQNLVDIQVVSEKTTQQMEKVFDVVIAKSKELSTSAKEYSAAALIYYQQGLADEEVARRTEITVKAARAAGEDAEQMSKNLTAIWNTYQMGGDRLQNAASIAAKLGAETAVDFKYIAEAMQQSATAAAQMGLSYENLAAIIATVGETTMQASSVVGTAYKTIISRFDQLKSTGTDGEVTLGRISQQLADMGIHILDASGELKSMDQIIYETGDSWASYSQKQQIAISEVLGGTRQFGQVLALFNNWDKFLINASSAFDETGDDALEAQFAIATKSIAVYADQAAEAWNRAFGEIADDDLLKGFYKGLEIIGEGVETILDSLGGLPGILAIIGVAFTKNILEKATQGVAVMRTFIANQKEAATRRAAGETGVTAAIVSQQKTGAAIARTQTGAEQRGTNRAFETDTLRYYDQLNEKIRNGSELEKAVAQAEKERFTALLGHIQDADVQLTALQLKNQQLLTSTPITGARKTVAEATAMVKVDASEADFQAIRAKLEAVFGKEPFNFEFNTTNAAEKIGILGNALREYLQNFQTTADEELAVLGTNAETAKAQVAKLNEELAKQIAIKDKAEEKATNPRNTGAKGDKAAEEYRKADAEVKKLTKDLQDAEKAAQRAGTAAEEFQRRMATGAATNQAVRDLATDFITAGGAASEYAQKLEQLKQKQAELSAARIQFPSMAEALGAVSSLTMGVSMLGTSLVNLMDGEGNVGQELLQTFIQLTFVAPMVMRGIQQITNMQSLWTAATAANTAAQATNTAVRTINAALVGKQVTAETVLAAARAAGLVIDQASVTVNGELSASLVAEALAASGVVIAETAMTGAIAANTVVTGANAMVWWAHPVVLILVGILALVVAGFAIFNSVMASNAKAARESAERQNEHLASLEASKAAIDENVASLEKQREALEKTTKGTEKYATAMNDIEDTLDGVRDNLENLGIDAVTLGILEQDEALAKANGQWDTYNQHLEDALDLAERQRLEQAEAVANASLTSARKNMDEGVHMGEVRWDMSKEVSDADDRYIAALRGSSAAKNISASAGRAKTYGADLAIDTSTPQAFIESYEAAQKLKAELEKIEVETGIGSDVTRELREELEKVTDEYTAIKGVIDDLDITKAQEMTEGLDPSSIKTLKDYRAAVNALSAQYKSQGLSVEDASAKAEAYYAYLSSQNNAVGYQLKELEVQYNAVEAAKSRGEQFGIDKGKMETAFGGLSEEDQVFFARVDLRGYDGTSDLGTFINEEIARLKIQDVVVNAQLNLTSVTEALEEFKSDGAAAVQDMVDWGSEEDNIIKYVDFLQMSAEQQEEYLNSMIQNFMETANQEIIKSQAAIETALAAARAQLQAKGGEGSDPQLEEYIDGLQAQADSNEINLKLNLLKDANMSQTIDELASKLKTGRIEAEQFEEALENVAKTEAEGFELDGDEIVAYAKHLQEVATSSDLVDDRLATNKKASLEAAIAITRLNRGIDSLADGFKDWNDVLKKSDKGSQEYFEAMQEMKKAMADVLNVSEEMLSNDFISKNLKQIEAASKGSVEALAELQLAAGQDIVLQFLATVDASQATAELSSALSSMQAYINTIPIEIRANLPANILTELGEYGQAFIDAANAAGMSAESIATSLQAMGYNANVVTTYEEQQVDVPEYTEYSEVSLSDPATYDGPVMTKPPTWQKKTWTAQTGMRSMTGYVPVTSVEIEGMNGSFGGNISNYSNVNKGGPPPGGSKGGGGGSKPKEKGKAPKADDSINERYKNIENVIDDTTRAVEKLNSAEEHTFGTDRLSVMQRKQKELLRLASAQAAYAKEARKYYDIDKADFMVNNANEAVFDDAGYLVNIEEIRQRWQKELDVSFAEVQALYDSLPDKIGEADEERLKAEEERHAARKEFVDEEIEKLEQLLETEEKVKEQIDAATETFRAMMQSKLDEAQYKMELKIKITDMDLRFLDYMAKRIDRMGASANKTSKFFDGLNGEIRTLVKQSSYITENVNRLNEIMNNVEDSSPHKGWFIDQLSEKGYAKDMATDIWDNFQETGRMDAEILDLLMEDADKLLDINESLFEAMYSAWEHYIETFQEFMDKFDNIVGRFDGLKERISSINGLLATFGMTTTRNAQQVTNLGVSFDLSGRKMVAFKTKAEEAAAWAADAKNHLDYALSSGNEDLIQEAQRTYDELQKTADEAYDEYLAGMQEFADNYVEIWGEMVDLIVADFSAKIFPLATSMDAALESLDLQREVGNFWLDAYQSGYQYDRLLQKIVEDTEDINDPAQRALYDEIQAEILEKQEAGALVTEKDVELWEKRLNIAKAQAAFEDAQKAKNTMRLARDASGNWNYVYSEDSTEKDETGDKKAEAEYDYYTAVKQAIDDYSAKLRETEAASLAYYTERSKQRALINADDSDALAKFDAETNAQMDRYTSLILWYAGKIDEYAGFIGLSHEDMALTITSGYQTATEEAMAYLNGVQDILVPDLNDAETRMRDDAAFYLGQIGVSFETLASVAQREIDNVKTEAQSLSTKLSAVQRESQRTLEQMSADMRKMMESWVEDIAKIIEANEKLAQSIRDMAGDKAGVTDLNYDAGTDYAELIGQFIEEVNQNPEKYGGTWKAGESTADALRLIQNDPYLNAQLKELEALRDAKIEGENMTDYGPTSDLIDLIGGGSVGWDNTIGGWVYWDRTKTKRVAISYEDMQRMVNSDWRPAGFNLGGLVTSPDGRGSSAGDIVPAMMTPGEYVLNPADTKEFFKTFRAFLAYPNSNSNLAAMQYGTKTLEQMIQIYADFPNVSSRDEIQAALNDLINRAKQFNV